MSDGKYATSWKEVARADAGIKNALRARLRDTILSIAAASQARPDKPFLRCVFCHYVFDDQRDDFEQLIVELKKVGTFIDSPTCLEMLEGKRPIDGRYFHLSFDDGFRNIFSNAFPILKRHDVPALFLVPSGLVEAGWEKAREFAFEKTHYRTVIEMVQWRELREMAAAGYEIGSHTKNHARFSEISKDVHRLEEEVVASKLEIEQKIGARCRYISWPYGRIEDSDALSLEAVRNAGYEACFGAYRGTVKPEKTKRFSIPRHHFEPEWPISHVRLFAQGGLESSGQGRIKNSAALPLAWALTTVLMQCYEASC